MYGRIGNSTVFLKRGGIGEMKTYNHLYTDIDKFREFLDEVSLKNSDHMLVRIHSAIHTKEQMQGLTEQIREILPDAGIIGCSTMQVISDGQLVPTACLISITVTERAVVRTARVSCLDDNGEWKAGDALAEEVVQGTLQSQEGFLLIFFPLLYGKIENFVETVNETGVAVKMLGGAANLEDREGNTRGDLAYVLEDTAVSGTDVVMALISAEELCIYGDYVCGVEPVGRQCPIVSRGCYIDQIDGIDGAQWYANLLGKDALQENPSVSHIFPVIKRDERGIAYYVDYTEESVDDAVLDEKHYVLKSFAELKNGSYVSLGYFHPQKIYEQVRELFCNIGAAPVETIFAYDCQSRVSFLHNCASWEIENFFTTNISGALLSGEISHKNGENVYANYTFVTTALSEDADARVVLRERELKNMSALQEDNTQMLNYLLVNANRHLNEELQDQQTKMQDAMFYNQVLGVDNQLKYLYDQEKKELDKAAVFNLNNERMLRLFAGITKTYAVLKETYGKIKTYYLPKGMYLYSYEDTSFLLAADDAAARTEFIEVIEKIRDFLAGIQCEEVDLSCTVAVVFGKEDTMPRLATTMRYARAKKLPIAKFEEVGDVAEKELEEIRMLHIIRDAMQHKRIRPYFQEIHNNKGEKKRMFESLMRIFDEDGKIYFPDQFLPVAKEYGLYESLSELMVETVIHMFRDKDVRVTINLNVQDIYDRKMLRMIFDNMQSVAHPENYVFEIVESEEIMDYAYIEEFADRIREYGARVAIDDFGSGFSNLLHVLKIKAEYIKIDGAIIRTITEDPHCLEFIRFINSWCVSNDQEVIAEFVENAEIQKIMMEIGVAHSQGYFFSRPHVWGEEDERIL